MSADLAELERRVGEKFAAKASERISDWDGPFDDPFAAGNWLQTAPGSPVAPTLQFSREQWVSYPTKRLVALMALDHLLDFPELTDEQWSTACLVWWYGGKTRVA